MSTDHTPEAGAEESHRAELVDADAPVSAEARGLARELATARAISAMLSAKDAHVLTEAPTPEEIAADRELAQRKRALEREQDWKAATAAAEAADRARRVDAEIEQADIRDLLVARKALAAQRRKTSPHAKLADLYETSKWSTRGIAAVVGAGMLWSATNVQHNLAPGASLSDPLYWFSYLIEAMISICLIILMVGVPKVEEWGVKLDPKTVITAEVGLLALTMGLNTYPYLGQEKWADAGSHAIAPLMIAVAMLIHHGMSKAYGAAQRIAAAEIPEDDAHPLTVHRASERATEPLDVETEPVPLVDVAELVRAELARAKADQAPTTPAPAPAEPVSAEAEQIDSRIDPAEVAPAPSVALVDADPWAEAEAAPVASAPQAGPAPVESAPVSAPPAPVLAPRATLGTSGVAGAESHLAPVVDHTEAEALALAEAVQALGAGATKSRELVAQIIDMKIGGHSNNQIHEATGVHARTIKAIAEAADQVRAEWGRQRTAASGGVVVDLHRKP
jgi:hypothetical protein